MWRNDKYTMDCFLPCACPGHVKDCSPWVPFRARWTDVHQERPGYRITPVSEEERLKDCSWFLQPPCSTQGPNKEMAEQIHHDCDKAVTGCQEEAVLGVGTSASSLGMDAVFSVAVLIQKEKKERIRAGLNITIPKVEICKEFFQTLQPQGWEQGGAQKGLPLGQIPESQPDCSLLAARAKVSWNYGKPSVVLNACG